MKLLQKILVITSAATIIGCGGGSGGGNSSPPSNRAPVANFTWACGDLECQFNSISNDPDGSIASYRWDFGDGSPAATIANPKQIYENYGTYNVTLTVTDDDGASRSVTRTISLSVDVHSQVASIDMNHPSIVFKQDFNHRPNGEYSKTAFAQDINVTCSQRYGPENCHPAYNADSVEIYDGEMKVTLTEGLIGSGIDSHIRLLEDYGNFDELYLTFTVRFDKNYDQLAKGGKLMGLGGHPDGDYPPTGCVRVSNDSGFSSRYVYKDGGSLYHYLYHQNKTEVCGDNIELTNFNFRKETTYTLEMRVKMNTPGERNGTVQTYINGVNIATTRNLILSESGVYGVNGWLFQLYIGGNTPDWVLRNPSTLYLDNFVLSTERVVN